MERQSIWFSFFNLVLLIFLLSHVVILSLFSFSFFFFIFESVTLELREAAWASVTQMWDC